MKEIMFAQLPNARPFLRWAGGKTWLIKNLINLKSYNFNNYHEAFLGGAATYFYLSPKNHSFLSDLNGDLIETYQIVRDEINLLIERLKFFSNDEQSYYRTRATLFDTAVDRAARFIFLNQTSFNGLHRVNLKGEYNVPFGFRKKNFLDEPALRSASRALANTTIFQSDFYLTLENIRLGDLIFLDPPYTVSHNNNGFIEYNEKIFSLEDQMRLSEMIDQIKSKGAFYILTNAAHETIDEIFERGDKKIKLTRGNTIGGLKAKRGQTSEFLFTNLDI